MGKICHLPTKIQPFQGIFPVVQVAGLEARVIGIAEDSTAEVPFGVAALGPNSWMVYFMENPIYDNWG